jgi:hypothetical protein
MAGRPLEKKGGDKHRIINEQAPSWTAPASVVEKLVFRHEYERWFSPPRRLARKVFREVNSRKTLNPTILADQPAGLGVFGQNPFAYGERTRYLRKSFFG